MSTASKLLDAYPSINLNNYDEDAVAILHQWASEANNELWELNRRLENANAALSQIQSIAEEK